MYSKYFGGGVSSDNPAEVETVRISKIASFGKNFLKGYVTPEIGRHACTANFSEDGMLSLTVLNDGNAYVGFTGSNGPHIAAHGPAYIIPSDAEKVYFKSKNGVFDTEHLRSGTLLLVAFFDGNKKFISFTSIPAAGKEIPNAAKYLSIRVGIDGATAGQVYTDQIMLSFEPITEWQPPYYEEVDVDLELCSLPTGTCDEVKDGKLIKRVGKKTFTGTETWLHHSPKNNYFECSSGLGAQRVIDGTKAGYLYCNRFKEYSANSLYWDANLEGCSLGDNGNDQHFRVRVLDSSITDLNSFKSWLAANPITIFYPLENPVITPLTDIIVPTQAPYAIVTHDSPVETEIEYEILTKSDYVADIIDIKQRLAALEAAAVGGGN